MDVRGGRVCWSLGEVALTVGRSSILAWGDAAAKARDGNGMSSAGIFCMRSAFACILLA